MVHSAPVLALKFQRVRPGSQPPARTSCCRARDRAAALAFFSVSAIRRSCALPGCSSRNARSSRSGLLNFSLRGAANELSPLVSGGSAQGSGFLRCMSSSLIQSALHQPGRSRRPSWTLAARTGAAGTSSRRRSTSECGSGFRQRTAAGKCRGPDLSSVSIFLRELRRSEGASLAALRQ